MTVNEMKNAMVEQWGFEHPNTIHFFTVCEKFTDEFIIACAFQSDMVG